MKRVFTIFILMFTIYANAQIPAPPQKNPILLKNGFIHTISKGVVEGSILFDKGKIGNLYKNFISDNFCLYDT